MNKMPDHKDVRAAVEARPRRRPLARGLLRLALAAGLLAAAVVGWRLMMATAVKPRPHPPAETVEPVRAAAVRLTSVRPRWKLYGEAVSAPESVLRFPLSGRIVRLAPGLREGLHVKKGQELARIDDLTWRAAVAEAEAALASARAAVRETRARLDLEETAVANARQQLSLAERELERARRLRASGALSEAALDKIRLTVSQRRLALAQRKANVEAARARLAQQQTAVTRQQWALRRARRNLADTVLRAPFAGAVASTAAAIGRQTGPSDQLITLVPDAPPQARLALSARLYGDLKAAGERLSGRKLVILWRIGSETLSIPARVVRIAPRASRGQGALNIFAAADGEGRKAAWLRPGVFVSARMAGPLLKDVALLPEAAVYDAARVYVLRDGRMRARDIRLRGYADGAAVVSGLRDGEIVIVNRMADPRDGRKVKVMKP